MKGESSGMFLLFLSNSQMFLKRRSFVLLSPCTDEYSQDLRHQKKVMVMRSTIVVEIVASGDEILAL